MSILEKQVSLFSLVFGDEWVNEWMNEWMNQPTNQPTNQRTNEPTNQRSSKWINANKNERGCLSRSLKSWFLLAVPLNFFKTIWLFGPKCTSNTTKSIVSVRCTGASNGPKKNSPAPFFLTDSLMSGYRMKPALLVFDVLREMSLKQSNQVVEPLLRTWCSCTPYCISKQIFFPRSKRIQVSLPSTSGWRYGT